MIRSKRQNRWLLDKNGICWDLKKDPDLPHTDSLEMSGKRIAAVMTYGADATKNLILKQSVVWPNLRTIPNDTHASLIKKYNKELFPLFRVDGALESEKPHAIKFDGILTIQSVLGEHLKITRSIFPGKDQPACFHLFTLTNNSAKKVEVKIKPQEKTETSRGVFGIYLTEVEFFGETTYLLDPKETVSFSLNFSGRKIMDDKTKLEPMQEKQQRRHFLNSLNDSLKFQSPDPLLNQAFNFAKIRAAESVFATKSGLMHSPGGLSYYAAVWTNDEAEYAGPLFPYLGDAGAIEASVNCYRLYRHFMGPDYKSIPTSIIAEGLDIWEGAGDRGDAAMYAYGAARFLLALGNTDIAKELFPAVDWCLEYCQRKMTPSGAIASDSDELEGRFPSGSANLSTTSLAYGALLAAKDLAKELGYNDKEKAYKALAIKLFDAIENHFGSAVEGFETYRYFEGNEVLRSWISLPLVMGITNRKKGTLAALFSSRLWTKDGLATQAGEETFWDRATLYAFRGAFFAGTLEKTFDLFREYTRRRTLGEHVPYAVEAYPEGDKRHLSAESALYCRVITEGLFGITPTGFASFTVAPTLPEGWNEMSILSIKAFQNDFDLKVEDKNDHYLVTVVCKNGHTQDLECPLGGSVRVNL